MAQMRKDVFTGRWVLVAEPDGVRSWELQFKKFTRSTGFWPFCENNEAATPREVFSHSAPAAPPPPRSWQG